MAYFRNAMFAAEPFEESQAEEEEPQSPDMLKAFYQEMEKKEKQELLERKASRRKSNLWRNNKSSLKRSTTGSSAAVPLPEQPPLEPTTTPTASNLARKQPESRQDAREMDSLEQNERNDSVTSLPPSRSIIPDALKELPAWYTKDDWSSITSFRARFPIHNPVGPRYYRNHHLIPPSMYRPGARPPSIFSPSFPAMGTSSLPERLDEATRAPGPSRTPSHSPLPTPSSSQTRVADLGIKPRSRKTSQTAHDPVDLLDVSDPWGTNWHHESPYDIGLGSNGSNGPPGAAADADLSRSRRSSTTQARRKTVTPSPLSQSTSAIHLQVPQTEGSRMPRKLSKRRGLSGIFGSHSKSHQPTSHSLPTTPTAEIPSSQPPPLPLDDIARRASTVPPGPPPSNKAISAIKKERRGSILGRLTKRFSVTRKPSGVDGLPHSDDHPPEFRSAFNKSTEKITKRVPPPSIENIHVDEIPFKGFHDADRRSSISVEPPFPAGKLMVANPDVPSSEISTPPQVEAPLPVQTNLTDPQLSRSMERQSSNERGHHHSPSNSSPSIPSSLSYPPVQAQNSKRKSTEQTPPLNGHLHASSETQKASSRHGHGASSSGHSHRQSLDDKPLPNFSEKVSSPAPPNARRSEEYRRPRSPERGPPPPSSTSKPVPLPYVSDGPPPPSSTTKPVPLPDPAPYPPSATTKPIPLPTYATIHFPSSDRGASGLSVNQAVVEESPLSTSSMLVNPPTPQVVDDVPIPSTSSPTIRHSSSREPSREPSPGISSVTVRETETFKLVRSKSGNVQTTIPAAGEQWEVEEVSQKRASKSRDKDRSRSDVDSKERDRRESRRQEKKAEVETEGDRRGKRSSRVRDSVDDLPATYSDKPIGRSDSSESHHRSPIPESMRQQDDVRSGRVRSGEHRSNRKTSASASPTKPSSSRPRERTSSKSARPTSEVPSAADLNALRAQEAWDLERLYKGRSMYGMDANMDTVAPIPTVPIVSTSVPNGMAGPAVSKHGAIHGSSHTSFVVQTGPTQIYHSMPTQPPPIIYGSPVGQSPLSSSPPAPDFFIRAPNPLPEPPREILAPRISQTFSDSSNKSGRPTEYWTKYAEVTTAH